MPKSISCFLRGVVALVPSPEGGDAITGAHAIFVCLGLLLASRSDVVLVSVILLAFEIVLVSAGFMAVAALVADFPRSFCVRGFLVTMFSLNHFMCASWVW